MNDIKSRLTYQIEVIVSICNVDIRVMGDNTSPDAKLKLSGMTMEEADIRFERLFTEVGISGAELPYSYGFPKD